MKRIGCNMLLAALLFAAPAAAQRQPVVDSLLCPVRIKVHTRLVDEVGLDGNGWSQAAYESLAPISGQIITRYPDSKGGAQELASRKRRNSRRFKEHELRAAVGIQPICGIGARPERLDLHWNPADPFEAGKFFYSDSEPSVCCVSGYYGFRCSYRVEIGAVLSYSEQWQSLYSTSMQAEIGRYHGRYLSVIPFFRYLWFDKGAVKMYSGIAIGPQCAWENDFDGSFKTSVYVAIDLTLAGICVGRKWFGFAECGVGALGVLRAGFGYRFRPKQKIGEEK